MTVVIVDLTNFLSSKLANFEAETGGCVNHGTYANNFLEASKGLEGILINFILKPMVTNLVPQLPQLQSYENMVHNTDPPLS